MILLTKRARQMMELAVQAEPSLEVSGFGRAEVRDDMIIVRSIFIPPQEVGSTHTDVEGSDLRRTLEAFIRAGTTLAQWPIWWHSHCSMGVSPSAQDLETLELLAQEVPNLGWFAGIVTNVKQEYHGWLEVTKPLPLSTKVDVFHEEEEIPKKLRAEVDKMMEQVKKKVWAPREWPVRGGKGAIAHSKNCVCATCLRGLRDFNEEELIKEMAQSGMFLGQAAGGEEV